MVRGHCSRWLYDGHPEPPDHLANANTDREHRRSWGSGGDRVLSENGSAGREKRADNQSVRQDPPHYFVVLMVPFAVRPPYIHLFHKRLNEDRNF